jgi:AcrR family transcriptional regulator
MKHPEGTRARLIDAAGQVFAEYGYQGAKVRDICRRARANIAAVNYHFGDKLGLYTEVLRKSVLAEHVKKGLAALDALEMPPEEKLRALIRARVQGLRAADVPQWQFRIIAHEMAAPTPAFSRVLDQASRPLYKRLRELVGSIINQPSDSEKTWLCVFSIVGQLSLYAVGTPALTQLWPGLTLDSQQLNRIAEHTADFSIAYLRRVRAAGRQAVAISPRSRRRV